ncbi:MAG: GH92 family glycosyl hydrolase [Bacteroidales bacterium]
MNNIKKTTLATMLTILLSINSYAQKSPVDYVNPFIGTTNYGITNPGAVVPRGMTSVVPFNATGSSLNKNDKDARWWSAPYEWDNKYFTGFTHVNLSGVGCPELGVILVMPTTGEVNADYKQYGSTASEQKASPGYFSFILDKYQVRAEATATQRTGVTRYTFPAGQANILLNLGVGMTNEEGGAIRLVKDNEVEGHRMTGTFCYAKSLERPVYFVARLNKTPDNSGLWKKMQKLKGAEDAWSVTSGKYKYYDKFKSIVAGDSVGAYFTFDLKDKEEIEMYVGVSYVSIDNARENLEKEVGKRNFAQVHEDAVKTWEKTLDVAEVEGGTDNDKTVLYTALYHMNINPYVFQDVNGDYMSMDGHDVLNTNGRNRYTVFSLWDTYRNYHQAITILHPEEQMDMVRSMVDMAKEGGWLPRWELNSSETYTMEGDPALPVIVDSYFKGLTDFDVQEAYDAMVRSATTKGSDNPIRPDIDHYLAEGYVPLEEEFDNSVSHALEYYIADWNLAQFAKALGKTNDYYKFLNQSLRYKEYYDEEFGIFRPKLKDGTFLPDFDPHQGLDFEPSPGFHEGNAWQYTFYAPHDIKGLAKLMGGDKAFVKKLQVLFDSAYYDANNEPDINNPYLFSFFKGSEWRTQELVSSLLKKHFKNSTDGLPGNDDCGTMSAWAFFSMAGFYPTIPGKPEYTLTTPLFNKMTIHLNTKYYKHDKLIIEKKGKGKYISSIELDGKRYKEYNISHEDLFNAKVLTINTTDKK